MPTSSTTTTTSTGASEIDSLPRSLEELHTHLRTLEPTHFPAALKREVGRETISIPTLLNIAIVDLAPQYMAFVNSGDKFEDYQADLAFDSKYEEEQVEDALRRITMADLIMVSSFFFFC